MILINGEYKEHIHVHDRGFQYGDGLFETIEVSKSQPVFLDRHLARLKAGCARLRIPPLDTVILQNEIKELCRQVNSSSSVLKIIITRGEGGRGYRPPQTVQPSRMLALYPFPPYPAAYSESGVRTRFCETVLGLNPALAGIKHLNRLEQIMARAEWDDPEIHEGLLADLNGNVIEGTMSNLFFTKNNILYTAPLKFSGVEGIIREIIIQLCAENGLIFYKKNYTKGELLSADEAFICNSIIGIWPVNKIDQVDLAPGSVTRQLQKWLTNYKAKDMANDS